MQHLKRHLEKKHKHAFDVWQEKLSIWQLEKPSVISEVKDTIKARFGTFSTRERRYFNVSFAALTDSNLPITFCETKRAKTFIARMFHLAEFRQLVNGVKQIPENIAIKPPNYRTVKRNFAAWSLLVKANSLSVISANRKLMRELNWPEEMLIIIGLIILILNTSRHEQNHAIQLNFNGFGSTLAAAAKQFFPHCFEFPNKHLQVATVAINAENNIL